MKPYILQGDVYFLGPNSTYELTVSALSHIIEGDFTERLSELDEQGKRKKKLILKGGLHTYQAWINFKQHVHGITHLRYYNSNYHKFWYFARTLQNDVVTLKIPRELFQSKAANLTKFPDTYYKSGYLWKTLFPKDKTKEDILNIINEALYNLDEEESQTNLKIGYSLLSNPLKTIKVRIQCMGNKINSAFPTWDQPMTGNNGKAYSHTDSISFAIAASTEYFDDESEKIDTINNIYNQNEGLDSVIKNTPHYFLSRKRLINNNLTKWIETREKNLQKIAQKINITGIKKLLNYLQDNLICKEGYDFEQGAYNNILNEIENNEVLFNAISIHQNIYEGIIILFNYDQKNQTAYFFEALNHLLLNTITHTGALDSWNKKILHNKILDLVLKYHDVNIIQTYIDLISNSPQRHSLYLEFDIANICIKKEFDITSDKEGSDFGIMNLPVDNYKVKSKYFKDYLLINLSENYFSFEESKIIQFVDDIIKNYGENFDNFIDNVVKTTRTQDFIFFGDKFTLLVNKIIEHDLSIKKESFSLIIKDYFRIQTAQRLKTFLRKPDLELNAMEYFDYNSEEYKLHTIIKHERRINVFSLEKFLDDARKLANYMNEESIVNTIEELKNKVWTERPPLPKVIPDYINEGK